MPTSIFEQNTWPIIFEDEKERILQKYGAYLPQEETDCFLNGLISMQFGQRLVPPNQRFSNINDIEQAFIFKEVPRSRITANCAKDPHVFDSIVAPLPLFYSGSIVYV
jgi:hypothetical protein